MRLPISQANPPNEITLSDTNRSNKSEIIEEGESLSNSWKPKLEDTPTLELPTDRPRQTEQGFRKEVQQFGLSSDLAEGLERLSCREGVTLFMTLMAAFQVLLHRYSGQADIVISTPIIGRGGEIESLDGKTLMLRTNLGGNPGFLELLAQVREVVLEAFGKQNSLIEDIGTRNNSNPLSQIVFVFEDNFNDKMELNEVNPEFSQVETEPAKFDLALKLSKTLRGLAGAMEYNAELFEAATVNRLTSHFKNLLEGIVARPELRLFEFSLLDESERRQLVVDWNNTAAPFAEDKCIHELFEAQVAATPFATAVVHENSRLTYIELNAQANRLAHQLRELGVKPDVLVAICLERGLHMLVGILATLKAGGGYVPLDPAYPKERLAFMLEDSAPLVLLTQNRFETLFPDKAKSLIVIDLEADSPTWTNRPDTNPTQIDTNLAPSTWHT